MNDAAIRAEEKTMSTRLSKKNLRRESKKWLVRQVVMRKEVMPWQAGCTTLIDILAGT